MPYYIYVIIITLLEIALVLNVRYLFSKHPLPTLVAVIIFLFCLIPPIIKMHSEPHLSHFFTIYTAFIFSVDLMFLIIMGIYYFYVRYYSRDEKQSQADYIIVLGSKFMTDRIPPIMMSRLEKTVQTYNELKDKPFIIVSGGKSIGTDRTEASIMHRYLVEAGIPDERIIIEDKSINTTENLEFCSIKIKKHWRENKLPKILIVTSEFHIPRAKRFAQSIGVKANFIPSITMPIFKWPAMFREFTAIIWYYRYTIETVMMMIIVILICTFVP
ncbi:YdcF family protein [Companilactobacillus mishanensis]|uniref:YdcF family protein n=1 Tax=Companilactobacillus mishanensis TaxID=2486008 RepID=A0ABW9P7J4_9LACO|nr:YdcF family protein [Companilactobacillus mishanensis]MQS45228.1 YdcF family protein [Companilactobacillus mishanensis]